MKRISMLCGLALLVLAFAPLAGCSQQEAAPYASGAAEAAADKADPGVEVVFILARADKYDGKEDKVVSQCPGCGLAMAGNADHAMAVEDYTLHFCSDDCRGRFSDDTAGSLMALEIPAD